MDYKLADNISFENFLQNLKAKMRLVFHENGNIDQMSINRGFLPATLGEIMSANPLSVGIPKKFGGRGGGMMENLALLSATSYESLALSLTFGINLALFLQPLSKYGNPEIKSPVFKGFIEKQRMGGLMITEPDFGSDALNMETAFTEEQGHYHLQGKKHWAGLTGLADYWLLTARKKTQSGKLQRDIDFFLCDANAPGQKIHVEEVFEN